MEGYEHVSLICLIFAVIKEWVIGSTKDEV